MPAPAVAALDITTDGIFTATKEVVSAKYENATTWASWAAGLLENDIVAINNLLGKDIVGNELAALQLALTNIALYAPSGAFTYNSPAAPVYDAVPVYAAQTLGQILTIPDVAVIEIGVAPATDVVFANSAFTDTLLDALKGMLTSSLATASTGLGDAEAGLFARETARQNDTRAKAYSEVTSAFSSRGFDMPPGALLAKQAEINSESGIRLSDSSSQIMAESARLAQSWNKDIISACTQLLDLLSRTFDSRIMRDFEAAKAKVQYAIEGFKQIVATQLAKADLNKVAITSTVSANQATVEVFKAQIDGQVEPIKAIASVNQAKAGAYGAAVQAATSDLNARVIPEELKLKGVVANSQIAGTKAEIVFKEAALAIETAARQLQLEVTTLAGLATAAAQMTAAALNGVSVSASVGFSGSTSYSKGESASQSASYPQATGTAPPYTFT